MNKNQELVYANPKKGGQKSMKNSTKHMTVPLNKNKWITLLPLVPCKRLDRPITLSSRLRMSCGLFVAVGLGVAKVAAGQGTWIEKSPLPAAIQTPAAATVSETIYVAGGFENGFGGMPQILQASLYAYNSLSDRWSTEASMPAVRESPEAACIGSNLYVIGGWSTSPPLPNDNLWVYNPTANSWSTAANFPMLNASGASGVINNKLYITTPDDGYSGYYTFLDVYDPASNIWTALASSPEAQSQPGFGVLNNKLYVAGGENNAGAIINRLYAYDPVSNAWTQMASMATARSAPASAVLNGKLYIFGGANSSNQVLNTVESYDPTSNSWTTESPLPTARAGATASPVNGTIYVIGGFNGSINVATNEAFTPSPLLGIAAAGNQAIIYWPAWATNYILQTTTNLNSPNWAVVTNGTPIIGVTLTNLAPAAFFRLVQE